uniref:Uncharacterized protein n=1 Tax=Leersia perrieri TaxID=77586 RepID=A0A0D9UWT5_9ORYZ
MSNAHRLLSRVPTLLLLHYYNIQLFFRDSGFSVCARYLFDKISPRSFHALTKHYLSTLELGSDVERNGWIGGHSQKVTSTAPSHRGIYQSCLSPCGRGDR